MPADSRVVASPRPLAFHPRYVEKVWGGRNLKRILGHLPRTRAPIGEAWLAWDGLRVEKDGRLGRTLAEVLQADAPTYLGKPLDEIPGRAFPLLVKFLDAAENLSVQVHPDDSYARAREGQPFGKCEMWYVLATEPGAAVYHGLRRELSPDELRTALAQGRLVDELERVEVQPGDVLINHPGTIHALGGGVVLYELQQSCDLTYRLYDWDRGGRELHLDLGLAVIDRRPHRTHRVEPISIDEPNYARTFLAASRYFAAELLTVKDRGRVPMVPDRWELLTALDRVRVRVFPRGRWRVMSPGETVLLPVGAEGFNLEAREGSARVIRAYVPDLRRDLIDPLRARGVADERIVGLGGDEIRSDLAEVVG